jgi:hypothetical protein
MQILNSFTNLSDDIYCCALIETLFLFHQGVKLAFSSELHQQVNILSVFKETVKASYIWM